MEQHKELMQTRRRPFDREDYGNDGHMGGTPRNFRPQGGYASDGGLHMRPRMERQEDYEDYGDEYYGRQGYVPEQRGVRPQGGAMPRRYPAYRGPRVRPEMEERAPREQDAHIPWRRPRAGFFGSDDEEDGAEVGEEEQRPPAPRARPRRPPAFGEEGDRGDGFDDPDDAPMAGGLGGKGAGRGKKGGRRFGGLGRGGRENGGVGGGGDGGDGGEGGDGGGAAARGGYPAPRVGDLTPTDQAAILGWVGCPNIQPLLVNERRINFVARMRNPMPFVTWKQRLVSRLGYTQNQAREVGSRMNAVDRLLNRCPFTKGR